MTRTIKDTIKSRKIAILIADGIDGTNVDKTKKALMAVGAVVELIAPKFGEVSTVKGIAIPVDKSLMTVSSVLYDAVYIPGGPKAIAMLAQKQDAIDFIIAGL